eukprot:gene6258-8619_t
MASKIIVQIIIQGISVVSKAFVSGYQQALKNAKAGGTANIASTTLKHKMLSDEALKILNIEKQSLTKKLLDEKFKRAFELNDPSKGGSFYLQSKIYRSKEVLDYELENNSADKSTTTTQSNKK